MHHVIHFKASKLIDSSFFLSKCNNNSQIMLVETLISTQIGSVGACAMPFHYETIYTSIKIIDVVMKALKCKPSAHYTQQ